MSLARAAVRHPVTTVMLTLMVILLGFIALRQIPVDLLPNIEYPVLVVTARYPGAAPEEVEQLVTRRLEEAVARMAGLDRITSTSREGVSIVQARFRWGTGLDQAALDMREKLDMVKSYLPPDVENVSVLKADPNLRPIMRLDLYGEKDLGLLTDLAKDVVKPALERLDGVAAVDIVGGVERKVFVDVDPRRLQTYGLTIAHVIGTLRQENISLPGGDVAIGERRLKVRTIGEFETLDDIEETRVASSLGATVLLRDLATITAGEDEIKSIARFKGKPSVCLMVQKQSGTNTVQIARSVAKTVANVSKQLPPGVELNVTEDQSDFIQRSVSNVTSSAIQGGVLAVMVLFIFLWDWRSTVVIGLSIPVSMIAAFAAIYFSGMTLNLMSLGGMAVGVGMLVDNSIVVLENVYRHHTELGQTPIEAAIHGSEEVGTAITASTLTNLVVFVPIVFTSDLSSHLFRQLALVVTYSISASLIVALTLVPVGGAWLLRVPHKPLRFGGIVGRFSDFMFALPHAYRRSLTSFIKRPRLAFIIMALCVLISAGLVPLIGSQFLPAMDRRELNIQVSMERGSELAVTDKVIKALEQKVATLPEVEEYSAFTGGSMTTFTLSSGGSEFGSVHLKLKPKTRALRSTDQVRDELKRFTEAFPGAKIRVATVSGVAGEEDFLGTPVQITMRGDDYGILQQLAREAADRLGSVESIKDVDSGVEDTLPELHVKVDRRRAAYSGLSVGQIGAMVRSAVQGETATRYRVSGTEYDAVVRFGKPYRESIADVENMLLTGASGQAVPLWQVAAITREMGPMSIQRQNQVRTITVRAQTSSGDLGSVLSAAKKAILGLAAPEGYSLEFTGQTLEMMGAFSSLMFVLAVAILLDYMILASQFESLVHPFTIMLTVPLAAIGSILGLFVTGHSLNVPSMIGLITLAGIVVNNAIVFVDYANQLRREGMEMQAALIETGATRLRPILMTSLTTIFGLMPLSLGIGSGAELEAPLAVVVMGGLTTATFLTLFVVPVFYETIERSMQRMRNRWAKTTISAGLIVCIASSVLLVAPGRARAAQYVLTPEEAVAQALATHPALKATDAKIAQLTILLKRANAYAAQIPESQSLPYEDSKTKADARNKYLVPLQAANGLEVAKHYRAALEANIRLATLAAYYSAVKARSMIGGLYAMQQALSEQVEVVRVSMQRGAAIQKDLYAAEAKLSEASTARAAVEAASIQATLALTKYLGYQTSDVIAAETPVFLEASYDVDQKATEAVSQRYEVFKAQKDFETARYDLELAGKYGASSPLKYVEYAQAAVDEAQAMLDYYTREVSFGARSFYAAIAAADSKYRSRCSALAATSEALRVAQLKKEQGLATDADVTLAKATRRQAEVGMVEAICDHEIAKAKFEQSCSAGTSVQDSSGSGQTASGSSSGQSTSSQTGSSGL